MRRTINSEGLGIIKLFEGIRLTAYRCPAGIPTIGYGSTGHHVDMGMTISRAEAEELLCSDLTRFEEGVARLAPVATDNQFSALVSFAFNLGLNALGNSTLLKKHRAGNYAAAKGEFTKWVNAGGKRLPGLVKRRAAEAELYGRA